ncbi:restriction endonuclease subunit S [Candidatus Borkfalkia ceftriaxoniphila]|uniref:Restriction endonuclease subunit S n=1 Tax=Candidatus Borkfalkia ceftriaxoniphila TaxID=2508949 RepID=A0A4Q2K7Y7_9FIRM|nr:restriction endonuclease subunit S [Candidatus Borkfalkia ceftriaxoniphila]RXZ58161.1 restriction endonuclease subunit S [Candidatus Borkfalkia ceftriaxoniphila]
MSKSNETTPNVPTLRFPNYSGEWQVSSMGKVCTFRKGYGISKENLSSDGTPCILYGELYTTYKTAIAKRIKSKTSLDPTTLFHSKKNDVIIPCSGETAEDIATSVCIPYDDILLGGDLTVIRSDLDGAFLSNQINSVRKYDIARIAQGKSIVHLQADELKKIFIAYPTIEEQQKISGFIDKIDERIEVQNKIISKYETLIKGIIDCLLNKKEDNYYTFKDLYLKAGEGGTPTTDNDSYYENGTIPFIKIDDLSQKYIKRNSDYITYLGLEKSAAWLIPSNSVIFSNGATIGRISINTYPIATKQGVLGIVPSPIVMTEYLYYYMKTTYFRGQVRRITVKGTMDCAYLKDLNSIICHIPEINHQEKRIALLTVLDEKIACERMLLQKLKEQKKYLLSKMFI